MTASAADVAGVLGADDVRPGSFVAVNIRPGAGLELAHADHVWSVSTSEPAEVVRTVEAALRPRWVWWRADDVADQLLPAGVRLVACWDLAAVHRMVAGGHVDDPAHIWADIHDLAEGAIPQLGQLDLLGLETAAAAPTGADDPDSPVLSTGYLRPGCSDPAWLATPLRSARWAALALAVRAAQEVRLGRPSVTGPGQLRPSDPLMAARSESAAALLCTELQHDGLPFDRVESARLLLEMIGPDPVDEAERLAHRRRRDATVLELVPGQSADLRNPAQVRELLAAIGITVPDTRSWRLEPFRGVHPVVDALLTWRKNERIETTYGYPWLARNVGPDGRLRGAWRASDGAAGRMTAQAGLHNLPSELRGAVAAEAGHVLVRADLGQVEPRVLAAVSGDAALVAATADADLYTPVAQRLGVERPIAKIAVLAAMYGQTSGAAGEALAGMEASYPTAMTYLREAERAGRLGQSITTFGGRLVRSWPTPPGLTEPDRRAVEAARGRFTRNAAVQGAAAELFKAWAATVRLELRDLGGSIVLCLHDELLVHAERERAEAVVQVLHRCLDDTARWWFGDQRTRFVAEVAVGARWSQTKVV